MSPARETAMARGIVVGWAIALTLFAILCAYWQSASGETLLDFALGVMVFAYAGLLGVFLTALLTPRGNAGSAVAALLTGLIAVLLLQPFVWDIWIGWFDADTSPLPAPAFPWRMAIATSLAWLVCLMGRPQISSKVG